MSFFFEDMSEDALATIPIPTGEMLGLSDQDQATLSEEPLMRQETLELVQAYYRIQDPKVRARLLELLRSLANLPDDS